MKLLHIFAMLGAPCLLLVSALLESGRRTNPPVTREHTIQENLPVPAAVNAMLHQSCYDCHSSETRWPWYSQAPGIGSLIEHDVNAGREAMNFSEWSIGVGKTPLQGGATLIAACEAVKQHLMPRPNYLRLHPEATPKPAAIEEFCAWAREQATELMQPVKR